MTLATELPIVETVENLALPLKEEIQENALEPVSIKPDEKLQDAQPEKVSKAKHKVRQRKKNPSPIAKESSQDNEKAVVLTSPVEKAPEINPKSVPKPKRKISSRQVKVHLAPAMQEDNKPSELTPTPLNTIEKLAEMNDENKTKSLSKISFRQAQPGRLVNDAKIILQTRLAQHLFLGQHQSAVGLGKFSRLVLQIWQAASQDDPYADLFLLRIYDDLIAALFRYW